VGVDAGHDIDPNVEVAATADPQMETRMPMDSAEAQRYRKGWLAAGIALGHDPSATVTCPSCGSGILIVTDATFPGGLERWMRCNVCRQANTLLMRDQPTS